MYAGNNNNKKKIIFMIKKNRFHLYDHYVILTRTFGRVRVPYRFHASVCLRLHTSTVVNSNSTYVCLNVQSTVDYLFVFRLKCACCIRVTSNYLTECYAF